MQNLKDKKDYESLRKLEKNIENNYSKEVN